MGKPLPEQKAYILVGEDKWSMSKIYRMANNLKCYEEK